jgi:hypothetical protein
LFAAVASPTQANFSYAFHLFNSGNRAQPRQLVNQ